MSPIRFAGITLSWQEGYAKQYSEKLNEMGFYAKCLETENGWLVTYCHRPFSRLEAQDAYQKLKEGSEIGEEKLESE